MTKRWISLLSIAAVLLVLGAAISFCFVRPIGNPPTPSGTLHFTSDDEALMAELLPLDGDEPLRPAFRVKDSEPLIVPAGSYRLRLSSPGRLSETLLVEAVGGPDTPLAVK